MRQGLEELEKEFLAPYAVHSQKSRGRNYPEEEHPYRTCFQRDRERILHTTAFRRLGHKTQVFVTYEGDHYRTRLTHTLETAQIARTLARALAANEDLTEAIALAHDLGHPPFGHAGERALHRLMEGRGGFDHNLQSLRIVEKLEQRYSGFPGLNLTWEVREGVVKHWTEYDRAEVGEYEPDKAPSVEAQLVSRADEIAFQTHDLDDGMRAEMLDWDELRELGPWEWVELSPPRESSDLVRHELIRRLINHLATDLIETTKAQLERLRPASCEAVRNLRENVVAFSAEVSALRGRLQELLMERLYRHYRVVRMARKAERIVGRLFAAYLEDTGQLPPWVETRIAEEGVERVICDYIAGMTDRFALQEYQKLFDPGTRV